MGFLVDAGVDEGLFAFVGAEVGFAFRQVGFAGGFELADAVLQPGHAHGEHHGGADESDDGGSVGVGAEVAGGDDVVHLGAAGQGCEGEGDGAECQGGGHESLGDAGFVEELHGDGHDGEGDDPGTHSTVGQ